MVTKERLASLYRESEAAIAIATDAIRQNGNQFDEYVIVVADLGHPGTVHLVQHISGEHEHVDPTGDKGFVGVSHKTTVARSLRACKIEECAVRVESTLGVGQIRVVVSVDGLVKVFDLKAPAPMPVAGSA